MECLRGNEKFRNFVGGKIIYENISMTKKQAIDELRWRVIQGFLQCSSKSILKNLPKISF